MIVKSVKASDYIKDLLETFENIRKHNMRLNLAKCSSGLGGGKFLGYLLTHQGIEADPSQIKAIQNMSSPKSLKDLQSLTGCIAALRRFIPQYSKKCLPMFKVKKASQSKHFLWTK